jgi:hypothetical protein
MDLYTITIPKGTLFYRGFSNKNDTSGNWFAYDISGASSYGNIVKEYSLSRDIKVINIQNGFFHIDYINKVNLEYTGINFNGLDERKVQALIPLGLPDFEFQKIFLSRIGYSPHSLNITDDYISRLYFNKNRKSFYEFDKEMVASLRTFYEKNCDGFTNPVMYVDKYSGNLFPRELYLFNNNILELKNEIILEHTGGFLLNTNTVEIDSKTLLKRSKEFMKELQDYYSTRPIIPRDTGNTERINTSLPIGRSKTRKNKRYQTRRAISGSINISPHFST